MTILMSVTRSCPFLWCLEMDLIKYTVEMRGYFKLKEDWNP